MTDTPTRRWLCACFVCLLFGAYIGVSLVELHMVMTR